MVGGVQGACCDVARHSPPHHRSSGTISSTARHFSSITFIVTGKGCITPLRRPMAHAWLMYPKYRAMATPPDVNAKEPGHSRHGWTRQYCRTKFALRLGVRGAGRLRPPERAHDKLAKCPLFRCWTALDTKSESERFTSRGSWHHYILYVARPSFEKSVRGTVFLVCGISSPGRTKQELVLSWPCPMSGSAVSGAATAHVTQSRRCSWSPSRSCSCDAIVKNS